MSSPRSQRHPVRTRGWIPDQLGAWVMVTVPLLVGVWLAGPAWIHVPLTVAWYSGFCAFFALGWWLRVRAAKRAAYQPPLLTYGAVCVISTAAVLWCRPALVAWSAAFGPLMAVAVWEAYRRRSRSLRSGLATVIASALLTPVAVHAAGHGVTAHVWLVTALLGMYFCGTIFVVKTLIRQRRHREFWRWSYLYHALCLGVVLAAAALGWCSWRVCVVFLGLVLRSVAMPQASARRERPFTAKTVGITEMGWTALVLATALSG